jgi:hypothetical protein
MNNSNISPETLAADATWFPNALDMSAGAMQFAKIDRVGLSREAFLDERMAGSVTAYAQAPLSALIKAPIKDRPKAAFIFHTAFCCSTLLARALDAPGTSLALKEPNILMGLANAYRMAKGNDAGRSVDTAADLILKLLARPLEGDERIVVKPTNTANNLVPKIAASGAPAILLYSDLKGFLVSVLKKGEACKAFIRKQYVIFALDEEGVGAIPERQALGFTDLQIAALVWRQQMEMFSRLLGEHGNDNLRSLDFRILLDKTAETLVAANKHLGLGIPDGVLQKTANGPVFQKNSKFEDQQYDAGVRAKDEAELLARHGQEIDMIEQWAMNLKLKNEIPAAMPRPLLDR